MAWPSERALTHLILQPSSAAARYALSTATAEKTMPASAGQIWASGSDASIPKSASASSLLPSTFGGLPKNSVSLMSKILPLEATCPRCFLTSDLARARGGVWSASISSLEIQCTSATPGARVGQVVRVVLCSAVARYRLRSSKPRRAASVRLIHHVGLTFAYIDPLLGLRCPVALRAGQFIDTYRGELITSAEADRREAIAPSGTVKNSYLYVLDKHVGENGLELEDCLVIDGELKGGPTRFINHSCEPNCRQFTVSYNKYDQRMYELAFFAIKAIPAGTELVFDYLDKDDEDEEVAHDDGDNGEAKFECRCGSAKCRGRLWL